MPVYTIETPSGHKLDIEAADEATALRGAQEWSAQQNSKPAEQPAAPAAEPNTSYASALVHGAAGVAKDIGKSGKVSGLGGDAITAVGEKLDPAGYESATERFMNPKPGDTTVAGYGVGSLPRATVEALPALATDLTAARIGKLAGWRGALAGGLLSAGARMFGKESQEAADKRTGTPNAEITSEDKWRGAASTAGQAALNQIALSKLAGKGAAKAGTNAAAELGKKSGLEGGTEFIQDAFGQAVTSSGSPGGISVDLHQAGGAGILGTTAAGAHSTPRAMVDASIARRFKDSDPDAAARFSERVQQRAGDENMQKGAVSFEAVRSAETDVYTDLKAALDTDPEIKQAIEQNAEARRAFEHVKTREKLTDDDLTHIENAVAGKQNAPVVNDLVKEAREASLLKSKGDWDESTKKFSGGISNSMDKQLRLLKQPVNALAASGLGAAGIYSGLGVYTPAAAGLLGGSYIGARALDKFTGKRSPAKTYIEHFSKPGTSLRNPIAPPPPPPPPGADPDPDFSDQIKDATDFMSARRANVNVAEGLLKKLAKKTNEDAQADAWTARLDKFKLYREDMKDAEEQMKARKANTVLAGERQAEEVGRSSPFVEQSGGFDLLNQPGVGPKLSKLASAASAFNKLQRDPAAEHEAQAQEFQQLQEQHEAKAEERRAAAEAKRVEKAQSLAAKAAERAARDQAKAEKAQETANAKAVKAQALAEKVLKKQEARAAKAPAVKPVPVDMTETPASPERVRAVALKPTESPEDVLDIPDFLRRDAKTNKVMASQAKKDEKKSEAPKGEAEFDPDNLKHTKITDADYALGDQAAAEFRESLGIPRNEDEQQQHALRVLRYRNSTAKKQARIRDRMQEFLTQLSDSDAENLALGEDLQKLSSIRRKDGVAAHVNDFLAETYPHLATQLKRYFGPRWAASVWEKQ